MWCGCVCLVHPRDNGVCMSSLCTLGRKGCVYACNGRTYACVVHTWGNRVCACLRRAPQDSGIRACTRCTPMGQQDVCILHRHSCCFRTDCTPLALTLTMGSLCASVVQPNENRLCACMCHAPLGQCGVHLYCVQLRHCGL